MNLNKLLESMDKLHAERCVLIKKKNKDYAQTNNAFANFEETARLSCVTVPRVFLIHLATKVVRLRQIIEGHVENESVEDTLTDLANYADLFQIWRGLNNHFNITTCPTDAEVIAKVKE